MQSDIQNTVHLRWSQRIFSLDLNGVTVVSLRCHPDAPEMAAPLAKLYIWAYCGQERNRNEELHVKPLPSDILHNARIQCAFCKETHSLLFPRWSVCPVCCAWVCARHVGAVPWRSCPHCRLHLSDYVGGAAAHTQEHRRRVVGGTIRENNDFFEAFPAAMHLIPDPTHAALRSKRQWEKAMFLARNFLRMLKDDFPNKMCILCMYVHTMLRGNSARQDLLVDRVGHPAESDQPPENWMRTLITFIVEHVFPGGRNGMGPDVRGGAASQDDGMPEFGQKLEEDDMEQADFPFPARDDEPVTQASLSHQFEQDLNQILEENAAKDEARQTLLAKARTRRTMEGAEDTVEKFFESFQKLRTQADLHLQDALPRPASSEPTIPEYVDRIRASVQTRFPDMDEKLLRVVTGALAVYRLRLTDLHVRELVMLLWVVEGNTHLRCHDGNIYFYLDGAFRLHRGVPPQSTLARCKNFFLHLEGLFRLMGAARLTTDEHLLNEV